MSGDVQPRKRKDKKKKKDEFTGLAPSAEERPTQAHVPASSPASAEGFVIMHAHEDHGTGGHWCAKLVFFILLGILVGLIGLIILENRGLADLDASIGESRYAAVFDGWVDEALPDNRHHDEHTFELTHPDDDDDHDNADGAHDVSEERGSEEQQDDVSEEQDEDSHDEEADEDSEEQDNEDSEESADEDSDREEEENSDEDNNDAVSDEQRDDNSDEQAEDQIHKQADQSSDERDDEDTADEENDASNEDDNEASNEQDIADSNEQDIADSNERDNEDSNEEDNADSHERDNEDSNEASNEQENSAEQNDDASEERDRDDYSKEESKEQYEDIEDSDQDNEEQVAGDRSEQENDADLEDIVKEADTQATSEGPNQNYVSDDESEIDDIQGDFSDVEEQASDYAKDDFQEEFLEDEVEQEEGVTAHGEEKPYEELDSNEEVVVDNAAGEQEYEERKAKEQQAAEEETSNLGVKFGVGVALVAVAHAVLVRKWRNAREQAVTGEGSERRMTLMEDSLLLGTGGKSTPKETSGKRVLFSPTTTEHEANSEESELEEEEVQYDHEPPVKSISSFFAKSKPPTVRRAPEEDEDDDIMQVEEFSKRIGFPENQSPPPAAPPKNSPSERNEDIEVSEDEMSEDEVPGDVEVISDDEVERAERPEEDDVDVIAEEEEEAAEEDAAEEEEDEEDVSDVDDVELMKRLEMKYGKLPDEDVAQEPTRKRKPEGGLSVETWADEPTDNQWRQQLDLAQAELDEGKVDVARDKYLRVLRVAPKSTRALWGYARSLDLMAEQKKSNEVLNAAIAAYNNLLNLGPALSDKLFKEVANRTINRIRFKGNALLAEPIHKLLIKRFDAEPKHRNDLAISYLMSNNPHRARLVLKEILQRWPNDGVALVHYGFLLKTVDNKLEEAITYLQRGITTGDEGTSDGRFFFQLGDALLMLGRKKEADQVHKMGSLKGIFLSAEQRSLYNVDRLLGRPWWNIEQTPYSNLVNDLEKHWKEILKEAISLAGEFGAEKEGLRSKGQWTQLDLFARGREIPGRCKKAPVTCAIVGKEAAAKNCRRGQIKFSALTPGTHIRPHVGPTNCRLRAHLGLTNTKGAYLRVHNETRTWHEGKVFIFDDSFEHEVWHNGTGTRIVLIVDTWHPELTPLERSTLSAI